jgi:hypothetical protein
MMSHSFDRQGRAGATLAMTSLFTSLLAGFFGCAKVNTGGPGGGGPGSGGNSGTGTGSTAGTGNTSGGSGGATDRMDAAFVNADLNTGVCQEGNYKYVPQIPTVYLMVDRSGSMFDCLSTTAVESSCTTAADTPWSKLDNHDAIKAVYDGLPFQPNTNESGKKFETPASQSLGLIGANLLADTTEGAKYILYVTDGEPDYCGDGNALCPPDGVVGTLQKLKTSGITTIVIGIKSMIATDLPAGVLEAFANAGAGEPTVAPLRGATAKIEDIYDACYNTGAPADDAAGGWTREFVATGKPLMRGETIGTYAATAGPTKPYRPDVGNQTMLINQLSQALSGVKSCTFNLNNLEGKMLKVDSTMLSQVSVSIQGTTVALDPTNGWHLNGTSELELTGTACATWRMPQSTDIKIQIPCAVIIVE